MMGFFGDFIGVISFLALAAIAGIWFFVPFAIFGTKDRLDDLIDAVDETNKHLADIKAILTRDAVQSGDAVEPKSDIEIPSIHVSR
ncbi:MAG: hypothetical protein HY941_00675 [Gammaproteobacteria bacterium]|nr:hypothetical protein [Gammaproteobacteria bacterium]